MVGRRLAFVGELFLSRAYNCSSPTATRPVCLSAKFATMSYRSSNRGGRGRGSGRGRGRGAYYAHKYGNRSTDDAQTVQTQDGQIRGNASDFVSLLHSLDGRQYPSYKSLLGAWQLTDSMTLVVDRVQADAYAPPSRARIRVPLSSASFPLDLHASAIRTVAFCDFLTRKFWRVAHASHLDRRAGGQGWSGSKGGDISVDKPGQHVLQRTSCLIDGEYIELRFTVGLPARGRTVQGRDAARILTEVLPRVVQESLFAQTEDSETLRQHVLCVEDQEALREGLAEHGVIAFVANGAVLPRVSGAKDVPMTGDSVVPFQSPERLEVVIKCPSGRVVRGMGVKPGISLIVGGGFHGKSTLLAALEVGVYNHVPGDGREFVVVHPDTVSVRAEDGRSVSGVDITPFINNLPFGKDTSCFSTSDASGSTSQATNIIEALEAGAKVLLTDEDLAATNFMMRDQRMAQLVPHEKEPITPMIHRIRALYEQEGVSSILVVGGAGDYFEVSDLVVMMDEYKPKDVTEEAKKISTKLPSGLDLDPKKVSKGIFKSKRRRRFSSKSIQNIHSKGRSRAGARVKSLVEFGEAHIDLSAVSQIVEISQTRAIAAALERIGTMNTLDEEGVAATIRKFNAEIDANGLDAVNERGEKIGNYSRPRAIELQAALNRLRGVRIVDSEQ